MPSYLNGGSFEGEFPRNCLEITYRIPILKYVALLRKTELDTQPYLFHWLILVRLIIALQPRYCVYTLHISFLPILLIRFNGPPSCRIAHRDIWLCCARQCRRISTCPLRVPILVPVPCIQQGALEYYHSQWRLLRVLHAPPAAPGDRLHYQMS